MDYFFLSVFGFAAGIFAESLVSFGWWGIAFPFFLSAIFLTWFDIERSRLFIAASVFLFAAAFGMGRMMFAPQALPSAFEPLIGTNLSLQGTVAADPDIRDGNQRVTLAIEKGGQKTRILAVAPRSPSVSYGEIVEVSGGLERPQPFDADGGRVFRYDEFLAKDGIFGIIERAHMKSVAPPSGLVSHALDLLFGAKHAFVRGLENALPEPAAALAEGLLVGGKQGLGKPLTDAFMSAGLIAIVVLSGYNVMIVAEGILRALSFLPKRAALSVAGAGILGFVIAAGSGASALRAGLMACLALFARSTGRSYDALRALFFALFLMLVWNPLSLVYDPGFELSFIATLGLILGAPIIEANILFIRNAFLREVAATTIAAQLAVLPLLLYLTGNLSLVSLPANLLVLPVVPLAMLFSFVAGLSGVIAPLIAPAIGIPAYALLSYIIGIGAYAATLPLAHAIIPAFPFAVVVLAYALIGWFAVRPLTPLRQTASRTPSN